MDGKPGSSSAKDDVYRVRLRCTIVQTMDVAGSCEAEAVGTAIQAFESRGESFHAVDALMIETELLPDRSTSLAEAPVRRSLDRIQD